MDNLSFFFFCRDHRSSRTSLLNDLEEGGLRSSSSYSHDINEHDNDKAVETLEDRVIFLKRVSSFREDPFNTQLSICTYSRNIATYNLFDCVKNHYLLMIMDGVKYFWPLYVEFSRSVDYLTVTLALSVSTLVEMKLLEAAYLYACVLDGVRGHPGIAFCFKVSLHGQMLELIC